MHIAYRNIGIILGFSAIFLVFTSSLAMNMNSEHFVLGKPPKFDKGASKFVKKLKERIKNQSENQRDNNKEDDVKKKNDNKNANQCNKE